ncbi:MAG: tail fiber domain-containing protein [Vicinamibacterales bacterium]
MQRSWVVSSFVVLAGLVAGATDAPAQSLGTFKWRTEPYCNVITVTVTPIGGVYALDGFDEQCGGNPRQPVRGVALPQANGSITIGLSIVVLPGGTPVNLEAGISQSSLGGTWRDSAGNSGQLTFGPTSTSGGPRPGPVPPAPPLPPAFIAQPKGSFVARGDANDPDINPIQGAGRRMVWHAGKAAFRAGEVIGGEWDDASVGFFSAAFGARTIAQGSASFAAGFNSAANGTASVALGSNARSGNGSFTFADQINAFFTSGQNQFNARATGGVGFYTNSLLTAGVELKPGASAWSSVSDVNRKEHFKDLDGDEVLAKLAVMPIREWNYKAQDAAIRHVGPTAQDFAAAFGLGEDPLRISTIDADGIALRAIQALEARTRAENESLRAQLAAMQARLDALDAARR